MKLSKSTNRSFNLLAVSVASMIGFSFLPEVFFEPSLLFKADDALPVLLAIVSIAWYQKGDHKHTRSSIPMLLVVSDLCIKAVGLVIETAGGQFEGDDVMGVLLLVIGTLVVLYQYKKTAKILKVVI